MESDENGKTITIGFMIGILVILGLSDFVIVPAGRRRILLTFGQVTSVLGEGLHFVAPIVNSVQIMSVQTLKFSADASAASKDLQDTKTQVAMNYNLNPSSIGTLYQNIGVNYEDTIIVPAVQEIVKATTAQYDAEQLITERPLVKDKIEQGLKERLAPMGIVVEAVSIANFDFSPDFNQAIEAKVAAQQDALKAQNILLRIQIEANQTIAQAQGQARAIQIINEQLRSSPSYNQYLAIQKWNGIMPLVVGGNAQPLINLNWVTGNFTQ